MKRGIAVYLLRAALFSIAPSVAAQQPGKIYRIGYLDPSTASGSAILLQAFRQELGKLGWVEGKNITIEYRFAEQRFAHLPELAAELVRLKVDIIATGGPVAVRAAMNATQSIPIVMVGIGTDPVEEGLVKSLARPGGNVTGITNLTGELGGKRLELLKEVVPKLARVAVLYEPAVPLSVQAVKEALPAAAASWG